MLIETAIGHRTQADTLGKKLANQLLAKGANEILSMLDGHK